MPLSDSSGTCMRAVRPEPSPAVLPPKSGSRRLRGLPVLVYEVSRRVWGLRLRRTEQELALSSLPILPSVHYKDVGVRIASFRSSMAHPACSPVYASLCTSRYPTQNSGPSGSLFLSRGVSSTPASYRFIPAHCNGDLSSTTMNPCEKRKLKAPSAIFREETRVGRAGKEAPSWCRRVSSYRSNARISIAW